MADQAELKTYRGNCHCAAYIFEVKMPEIKVANRCNCSVCYKKGVLYGFAKASDLNFVKGERDTLTNYTFGSKTYNHQFCPTCGTSLLCFGQLEAPKPGEDEKASMGVNLRAIQDLNIWNLETFTFDGASIPPVFEPAKFTGQEPRAELEGGKIFTGSCHCGAVRIAVKSKPLDKTYEGNAYDCKCSICSRYGTVWIYPQKEHVSLEGEENLTRYYLGMKICPKSFCKTCGIVMDNKAISLSDDEKAKLPEAWRNWLTNLGEKQWGVNFKVLDGVDLEALPVTQLDGWNLTKPLYVNP